MFALTGAAALAAVASVRTALADQPSTLDSVISTGTLRVGWAVIHPDFYREPGSNEYRGMAYDIVSDLAKTMKVKLELIEDNWSTLVAGIQSNKFDITIPALGVTLPRALAVSFSAPVYQSAVGLLIRKQDGDKFKSLSDFDKPDVRISVTLGSNSDMFLTRFVKNAQILRVKGPPDSLTQLMTNRADAMCSPTSSLKSIAKEQTSLEVFDKGVVGFSPVSFAFRAGDYRLKEYLDDYIGEIKSTGQLQQLYEKYGLSTENLPK
jgi:ABC-type amino acid transport substrate-binding protein